MIEFDTAVGGEINNMGLMSILGSKQRNYQYEMKLAKGDTDCGDDCQSTKLMYDEYMRVDKPADANGNRILAFHRLRGDLNKVDNRPPELFRN